MTVMRCESALPVSGRRTRMRRDSPSWSAGGLGSSGFAASSAGLAAAAGASSSELFGAAVFDAARAVSVLLMTEGSDDGRD